MRRLPLPNCRVGPADVSSPRRRSFTCCASVCRIPTPRARFPDRGVAAAPRLAVPNVSNVDPTAAPSYRGSRRGARAGGVGERPRRLAGAGIAPYGAARRSQANRSRRFVCRAPTSIRASTCRGARSGSRGSPASAARRASPLRWPIARRSSSTAATHWPYAPRSIPTPSCRTRSPRNRRRRGLPRTCPRAASSASIPGW